MQEFIANPYTVLLVDSDVACLSTVAELLQRVGYRTRSYTRAEELLDHLNEVTLPACVIAEMELPGMNGVELSRCLRDSSQPMPVIILTAASDVPTAVRALRGEVLDYLTKPFVERDLVTRLHNALARHGARLN